MTQGEAIFGGLFCFSLLLSQKIRLCCQGLKIKALKP